MVTQAYLAPLEREYVSAADIFHVAVTQRADALEAFIRAGGSVDDIDVSKDVRKEWQRVIAGRLRDG